MSGDAIAQRGAIRNLVELNITLFSKIEALEIESRTITQKFHPTFDRLAGAESEINNLKRENQQLKYKLAAIEDATKTLYLRIEGIPEKNNENLVDKIAETLSLTGVQCLPTDIDHAYRLGKYKAGQTRPIIVRFVKEGTRNTFLYNRSKLNKNNASKSIWINDDVSDETRMHRKTSRDVAALARFNGVKSVKVHSDGIIIDSTKYKHADFDLLPLNLSVSKAKTRDEGEDIYFQGEESPLSNFHPSKFADENGLIFYTAEQAFQHAKAKFHNKHLIANKILCTRNPRNAKQLSKQIPNSKEWIAKEEETMKAIIRRKFQQNQGLADQLINTGDKQLHEATSDPKWGTGAELASKALSETTWSGQDLLGSLLEQVREELVKGNTHRKLETSVRVNELDQSQDDDLLPMRMAEVEGDEDDTPPPPTPAAPSPRALQAKNKIQEQKKEGSPNKGIPSTGSNVVEKAQTLTSADSGATPKHSTTGGQIDFTSTSSVAVASLPRSPSPPPRKKKPIRSSARAQGIRDRKAKESQA